MSQNYLSNQDSSEEKSGKVSVWYYREYRERVSSDSDHLDIRECRKRIPLVRLRPMRRGPCTVVRGETEILLSSPCSGQHGVGRLQLIGTELWDEGTTVSRPSPLKTHFTANSISVHLKNKR